MARQQSSGGTEVWLGKGAGGQGAFGEGGLWIGQHAADQDILVFDPAESDVNASVISLYSLTHHRTRSFPRATVLDRIHPLEDELAFARARKDYEQRATLRAAHEEVMAEERTEQMSRQREPVLAAHRRYIESLGLDYQGERETPANHRPGRRSKCHACGIALDDFAGVVCVICDGVLCSCGACACKHPDHQR
jgi:hypothetical protein